MNKVFKTIWNEALCSWVPVAEITKAHGKGRGGKLVVAAIMAAALWVTFSSAAYAATGDSSTGAFVDSGDSGSASLGTYNGVTSSGGILSAKSGGNLTVTTPDVNVTNTGDGNAIGIYASGTDASGTGSTITLNNATVSTTAGANSWMSMDDALRAESGGVITATGTLNLSTAGSQAAGIRASGAGSIVNAGDIIYTGTGNASTGLWATGGGAINTGNVNISINSTGGSYGYGLLAEANSTISITGGTINENDTTSTSNSAVRAIGVNSIINVTGPLIINTKNSLSLTNPSQGAARGVYASGGGTVNLSDITITTTGTISNGFEVGKVVNAAGEGAGGINVDGNINVAVSGLNAVALAVQAPAGAGSSSDFETTSTSTTKLRASSGAVISYQGGNGSLITLYNVDIAPTSASGSNAAISVGKNFSSSSLTPPAAPTTNAELNLYNTATTAGTVKAGTSGSLVDVNNSSSFTLNADGNLTLTGITTMDATSSLVMNLSNNAIWQLAPKGTAATGRVSTLTTLNLDSGSTLDASGNTFTINGDVNNNAGIINLVKSNNTGTTLTINGIMSQGSDGALNVAVNGTTPVLIATSATLTGTLNVVPYTASLPQTSSAVSSTIIPVIHTTGGITGDFDSTNITGATLDYLLLKGYITPDTMDYDLGYQLAWTSGSVTGNGVFTIASGSSFEVDDTALNDEAASATGWNGKDLTKNGAGTLILDQQNGYTGITTINEGTLQAGTTDIFAASSNVAVNTNGILDLNNYNQTANRLSGSGNVTNTGATTATLTANNATTADNTTFDGIISGPVALTKTGAGTLTLTAANTYTGGTAINGGTLQISTDSNLGDPTGTLSFNNGTLNTTATITSNRTTTLNAGESTFDVNNGTTLTMGGTISGTGTLTKTDTGTLVLTGANSYTGATNVNAGSLYINGNQTAATGATTVASGATLGGTGTIGGNVTITGGTLDPGGANGSIGTLTINGNLALDSASTLKYNFGQANANNAHTAIGPTGGGGTLNDLTVVNGNLTLDGTLNVTTTPGGAFTPGVYRVINYAGTLTGTGLSLGTLPTTNTADYSVQTSVANQVNLIYTAGLKFSYWDGDPSSPGGNIGVANDGTIQGGNGTWNASNNDWTNDTGTLNGAYDNPSFAVFQGAPGIVTVDNSDGQIISGGMSFGTSGYIINGDQIELAPGSDTIQVGDGTTAGGGYTATISSELTGTGGINKTDAGTLVLSGNNSYAGGTTISGGTLQLGNGGTSGSIVGDVTDNGTLAFNRSDTATFTGNITGTGTVNQNGVGTTVLTGQTLWTGGTTINAGTLTLDGSNGGAQLTGTITGQTGTTLNINNGATWNLTGNSTVGNLNGNNGNIAMNTNLAAGIGDQIAADTANGNIAITVSNTGGTITGKAPIVELIDVANPSASSGNYTLSNGPIPVGLYNYNLLSGKQLNYGQANSANWYLAPSYGKELTTLVGASDQTGTWLMANDSLLQRMGELRTSSADEQKHSYQTWIRGYGWQANINTDNSQISYKENTYGLDLGADKTYNTRIGKIYTGIMVGYGNSRRSMNSGAGQSLTDTVYGGIYGTWINSKGYYIDALAKLGNIHNNIKAYDTENSRADYSNWGITASLEAGKQFKTETGWYIEPQAQITILNFTGSNFATSGNQASIEQRNSTSYDLRAGIVAGKNIKTERGSIQPYLKGMYGRSWTDQGGISYNGDTIVANTSGDRYQVGGGVAWQITQSTEVHADYEYIKGSRIEVPWKFNAGLRYNW